MPKPMNIISGIKVAVAQLIGLNRSQCKALFKLYKYVMLLNFKQTLKPNKRCDHVLPMSGELEQLFIRAFVIQGRQQRYFFSNAAEKNCAICILDIPLCILGRMLFYLRNHADTLVSVQPKLMGLLSNLC